MVRVVAFCFPDLAHVLVSRNENKLEIEMNEDASREILVDIASPKERELVESGPKSTRG